MIAQQLILDLSPGHAADFDHFIPANNKEALDVLLAFAHYRSTEPLIYLWGEAGCGKSHLLQACVSVAQQHGETAHYLDASIPFDDQLEPCRLMAVDNVEQLSDAQQIWLFNRINAVREGQGRLVCAGNEAPKHLPLRADVTSRLGWHLVYHINPLTDADKQLALSQWASHRGFQLTNEFADYLMRHWRRDLPSLIRLLEQVDRYSLQTKRPITLPLLRKVCKVRP